MAIMEAARIGQVGQKLQFALWEGPPREKTHMVALYDIAPRFIFDITDGGDGGRKIVERDFTFAGGRYRITLKPTRLKCADGSIVDRYLGEREQIVEEVIRRLATNYGRLTLRDQTKIRFSFSTHEVSEELRRVKHTYSIGEICEALTLLNEVRLSIEFLDMKGSPILSAAPFPVLGIRKRGDATGDTFVEFNPLVADAIRLLSFQQVDYETLMEIRDPVTRWLFKRLHIEAAATKNPIQMITANDIKRDSGMPIWKHTRNLFRRVGTSVEALVKLGVVERLEVDHQKDRNRILDVVYTLGLSADFMSKVHASNRAAKENSEEFQRLANGSTPGDTFVNVTIADAFRIRAARASLKTG